MEPAVGKCRRAEYRVLMPDPTIGVLWHCASLASCDYATLQTHGTLLHLTGVAVLPREGVPCRIGYQVAVTREWSPLSVSAVVTTPGQTREIHLASHGQGRWLLNDQHAPTLDGCTDIDLGWTPATNTIPIRRLDLSVGERATISTAWIRFPELDVVPNAQTYERLDIDRWRYLSGPYDFELVTDVPSGLVLAYGQDLWRAVALTTNESRGGNQAW